MKGLDNGVAAEHDIRGASQYSKVIDSAKIATTGFCSGGALALLAAINVPEVDPAVVWYSYARARVRRRNRDPIPTNWPRGDRARA